MVIDVGVFSLYLDGGFVCRDTLLGLHVCLDNVR